MLPLSKHRGQLVPEGDLGDLRTHLNRAKSSRFPVLRGNSSPFPVS
jgi:hypothetical protein